MIRQANNNDLNIILELSQLLWKNSEKEELQNEMLRYINSKNSIVLIAYAEDEPIGFVQCSLRHDYVEGTKSSPVGYLEGIYLKPYYRSKGIGRKLLEKCEVWAKNQGCLEFASDCGINNVDSLKFHLSTGFEEVSRVICFKKEL